MKATLLYIKNLVIVSKIIHVCAFIECTAEVIRPLSSFQLNLGRGRTRQNRRESREAQDTRAAFVIEMYLIITQS